MDKILINDIESLLGEIEQGSIVAIAIPTDLTSEQRDELDEILKSISEGMGITIVAAAEGEEYKALLDNLKSEFDDPEACCLIPVVI